MIINSINYTTDSLIVSINKLTIDSIDFISKKITISKTKTNDSFLIYKSNLNINDNKKLLIKIYND